MPITQEQSAELIRITEDKLRKMFDDKKQTPKLLIPKFLPSFIKTKTYVLFIEAVFEYCSLFNNILKQYEHLKSKMQDRVGEETSILKREREALGKLERQVSYNYSAIIISFNAKCMEEERKRSNFKDQVFFEALIYLVERIMKEIFSREDFLRVQEEVNRLFRTNRYNLIKKRHQNDQILHRYPALKQHNNKNKNNLTHILGRAPDRINAFKKFEREKRNSSLQNDYTRTLGIPKELPGTDMEQRSPLLCTWLPSRRSMLEDFTHSAVYYTVKSGKDTFHTISDSSSNPEGRSRIANLGSSILGKKV